MKSKLCTLFVLSAILVATLGNIGVHAAGGLAVYVVPAITDNGIIGSSTISSSYLSNTIQVSGSPGEYVPASFVVQAPSGAQSLQVSATGLTGSGGTIPAANIDLSSVKAWYQGGYDMSIGCYGRYLIPELLLKNDALVSVDGTLWSNPNGANSLLVNGQYVPISARSDTYYGPTIMPIAQRPITDATTLQPVNIASGTNKQFWVTVNIPKATAAGTYQGTINLSVGGTLTSQIQLNLQVLPINLLGPSLTYSIFYRGLLTDAGSISSENKTVQQMTAELQDMYNHGVTNPMIYAQPSLAALKTVLTIRQQLGMSNQPVFAEADTYGGTLQSLVALYKSYGATDVYFYGVDEGTDAQNRALIASFHNAGAKAFVALTPAVAASLADVLDLAIVSGTPSKTLAATYHQYGHKIFSYANPVTVPVLPATYRTNYGLLLWQADYDGCMNYAYQVSFNDIWNNFDSWTDCRDHAMAYPTMNGVIDTLQWEGFRAGVNDTRYLTTLLAAVQTAKAAGKDTSTVDNWLATLKTSNLTTLDLNAVRSQMTVFISTLSNVNSPPVLNPVGNKSLAAGSLLKITVSGSDPNGDPLTYSASNLPSGATFVGTTFSWAPTTSQVGAYPNVVFQVSDGKTATSESITITVTSPSGSQPPVLNPIGNKTVVAGSLLKITVSGSDPNGDPLTFSASNLPWPGASFQANNTFYWTPTTSQVGTYPNVVFQVSDGKTTTSESITITVTSTQVNQPPVLNPVGNKSLAAGSLLNFTVSGSDPNGDPLTYSASNLPSGATFVGTTFSWASTTSQVGTYPNVVFQVSDGKTTTSESITITVTSPSGNQPPVLNPIGNKTVVAGSLLKITVSGSDPNGDPLTFSASNLPWPGASFQANNTFYWTPTTSQVGTYPNVVFQVSDGKTTTSESITITVTSTQVNQPPVLNPIGNKTVVAGSLLKITVSGSDPNGDPLTYSASNLPWPGASFQANNTFYWTPTTSQVGTYPNVVFQVSDGKTTTSESITITVTSG